jgi:hypothetical protein
VYTLPWLKHVNSCYDNLQKTMHGFLWHRYSVAINQVIIVTVKRSKWWLQLHLGIKDATDTVKYPTYIGL